LPQFKSGIVVSAHPLATKIGVGILRKGGNAVDAAVGTALGLGVGAPAFSGIGGGGFALIWLAREGKAVFVDYRERAPHAAKEDMFRVTNSGKVVRDENSVGYRAVAVPGAIAGHSLMLEKYGRMKLREVIAPCVSAARKGLLVTKALAYAWKQSATKLKRFKKSSAIYLKRGEAYREGDKLILTELAESYSAIAHEGASEFYSGQIAKRIVETMESNGGLLSRQDLESFKPTIREPIHGSYKGFEVISAPPPSSGGAIIQQTLNMLEDYPTQDYGHNSAQALHVIAETLGRGFVNCRAQVGDPDFSKAPIPKLLSKDFASILASTIRPARASLPDGPAELASAPTSSTSHLVAIDSEHNIVSLTESVECYFGSGIVVPGTGIVMNDTMHDFDPRPNQPNSVASWKIPMSSMSPTIILKNGTPFMAVGSAGATRIVSSTLQTILNVLDFGMTVKDAVAAPRIHVHKNQVQLESSVGQDSAASLREMGYDVRVKQAAARMYFGGVHAAIIDPDNTLEGGSDPRRNGLALGLTDRFSI
jgi:gamma-glutamyltranspeptidase/glutathione hydrolase